MKRNKIKSNKTSNGFLWYIKRNVDLSNAMEIICCHKYHSEVFGVSSVELHCNDKMMTPGVLLAYFTDK